MSQISKYWGGDSDAKVLQVMLGFGNQLSVFGVEQQGYYQSKPFLPTVLVYYPVSCTFSISGLAV